MLGLDCEAEYDAAWVGGGGDDVDLFLEEGRAPALGVGEMLVIEGRDWEKMR